MAMSKAVSGLGWGPMGGGGGQLGFLGCGSLSLGRSWPRKEGGGGIRNPGASSECPCELQFWFYSRIKTSCWFQTHNSLSS